MVESLVTGSVFSQGLDLYVPIGSAGVLACLQVLLRVTVVVAILSSGFVMV